MPSPLRPNGFCVPALHSQQCRVQQSSSGTNRTQGLATVNNFFPKFFQPCCWQSNRCSVRHSENTAGFLTKSTPANTVGRSTLLDGLSGRALGVFTYARVSSRTDAVQLIGPIATATAHAGPSSTGRTDCIGGTHGKEAGGEIERTAPAELAASPQWPIAQQAALRCGERTCSFQPALKSPSAEA